MFNDVISNLEYVGANFRMIEELEGYKRKTFLPDIKALTQRLREETEKN